MNKNASIQGPAFLRRFDRFVHMIHQEEQLVSIIAHLPTFFARAPGGGLPEIDYVARTPFAI